ncbi:MAG: DegT/DnrJ/EryC1/StrS family aminotransferase, partial [Bacilli bacterium]
MNKMNIPFSPPDMSDAEIAEVIDALKSGWITTGPKTKQFEKELAEYIGSNKVVC